MLREQQERDAKMRLIRFKNRLNVDELIQPILNLEIVDMYQAAEGEKLDSAMFPVLPMVFDSASEYFSKWLKLFLYETYN